MAAVPATVHGRPPPWRDVRVLRFAFQIVVIGLAAGAFLYLGNNLTSNLRAQGIRTDFGYLGQPAGFAIADSSFKATQSVGDALLVGVRNTASLALIGIVLATILGVIVGIARLSSNWLVRKLAAFYVEAIRNIPVLVIIIFTYTAVVLRLPALAQSRTWLGSFLVSNNGIVAPSLTDEGNAATFWIVSVLAAAAAIAAGWWRTKVSERAGGPHHRVLWSLGVFTVIVVGGYAILGGPVALSLPSREGFVISGGVRMPAEFAAMLLALVVYTASHIAEIVRGSILAVAKGQSEAARALGLSEFARLRYIVLPQATRIMIPPLANQFLNLTKNSSLAVFIGYADVTSITGIIISQGNPAPQAIAVLMGIYLAFSLTISLLANLLNRRLHLETRG